MTLASLNLVAALPEIWLLFAVSAVLLIDLFIKDEQRDVTYTLSLIALVGSAVLTVQGFSWMPRVAFAGMFVADAMSDVLKLGMYAAVGLMLAYSRAYAADRQMYRGELFTLSLFALLGMMVMASATNLLTLYVGLELLSLSLYALVALPRDSKPATEAAMKYFVLGALASGMLLYGMSMIYGATGSLDIHAIAAKVASGTASRTLLVFGLVFIVTGIGFKLGNVPFHMWVPDVYQGSPTAVTLLIGSAPKLAAFAFVMRLLVQALPGLMADWQGMLIVLAVLSIGVGNLVAIAQTNLKRMLAYSTISHMGFMLLGILAGTLQGYAAGMFYAIVYAIMAVAGFGVVLLLSRAGFEAERLADLKGLAQRSPWFAWMFLLVMFSMAGIPVFVGFFAKLAVIQAIVDLGLVWLAVVAVLFSLVGAFYYLRVVKLMFMDEPVDSSPIAVKPDMRVLLSINCLAVLVLGLMPDSLLQLCFESIRHSLGML
ncbi:NADH-quinone oxidoreductase subunit NuoN [Chitinimonas sp. BJB300]|uniref:NADH-quinone oxidoreductase subunit NuoN n=1 Tax=Chitinimonas sp. BJB300 TaxID=1559339 RepID=UPI000C121E33|nr:NADH-quinone oxidoreductase subunit NuoN [Chitinimonas sp. BJB300]PHV10802.1 NADH-quinone oxidoreductase subunit NuoN [Chitinimonas sp. BJB300]TSJ87791.1 NADH-quinone oxidoreductase subunit NuoN [Chitinimonas sp. BJB300]